MIITRKQIENGLLIFTVLAVFCNDFLNTLSSAGVFTFEYGTYLVVLFLQTQYGDYFNGAKLISIGYTKVYFLDGFFVT